METKLVYRLAQTADRQDLFQQGVEKELRQRLRLVVSRGIVSADGFDIDRDGGACALQVNGRNQTTLDVAPGVVVFANGEYVEVLSTDINGAIVPTTSTDAFVVRLEYGEVASGDNESNPHYDFNAQPLVVKKTPAQMLVIETVAAYNSQAPSVKNNSVVLGIARFIGGSLELDNGRDTYTFSRPWASPADTQHRSMVGSGISSPFNPHGTSANDLSVGSYTLWQALAGPPAAVLARPLSVGAIAGRLCEETIPAGSIQVDSTGGITGVAGAFYGQLGSWPHKLMKAFVGVSTEVPAWIPQGRNVVAVFDPVNFTVATTLNVVYTEVEAGALPESLIGATSFEVKQPNSDELLVAGGNFISELSSPQVHFTDVGLIPMHFDVMVDGEGKVYKSPSVVWCNTRLTTMGSAPVPAEIQPRKPSRLRVGISNFNAGFTTIAVQISGTNEAGTNISETVTFSGPLPAPVVSFTEVTAQRKFTTNVFASIAQYQVLTRTGDGPNTTVTVFAEAYPERPETADDLKLATVLWSGSDVSANYQLRGATTAIDRRRPSKGGALKPTLHHLLNDDYNFSGTWGQYVTYLEDFQDPNWVALDAVVAIGGAPIQLASNALGLEANYISRLLPFKESISNPTLAIFKLIPATNAFPNSLDIRVRTTWHSTFIPMGGFANSSNNFSGSPFPPWSLNLTSTVSAITGIYAVKVTLESVSGQPLNNLIQGWSLHVRK